MNTTSQNIYITGTGQGSGKSVVMLAMMELYFGHYGQVGFFRPIIKSGEVNDELIELVRHRYQLNYAYESMYGCTSDEARELLANDHYDELLKTILNKYHLLKSQAEHIICVGSDYNLSDAFFKFHFNADVANNLGCLLMPVIQGSGRSNADIIDALASIRFKLQESDSDLLAIVINGVAANQVDLLRSRFTHSPDAEFPVYVIPTEPSLEKPSIGNIARRLGAKILSGQNDCLNRQVLQYKVAAMQVHDFLDYVEEGDLIITPGDRSDIILSSLMAHQSTSYPHIAGILLTGKQQLAGQIQRLLEGLGELPFAVLGIETDTFTTALNVSAVQARLYSQNMPKIATALGLVESNMDMNELKQRLFSNIKPRVTPLMFEYELLQRAKSAQRHIVLPEGEEERILRAAEILQLRGVVKLTLLGNEEKIRQKIQALGLRLENVDIIDPIQSELRSLFARTYFELRQHKGVIYDMAYDLMADVSYFGTMMVYMNYADGMVSGAIHTTQHTIRPAFEIIKTQPGTSLVSSVFFMCLEDRVLVYGDCAVNPEPNAKELADIAINSSQTAQMFNIDPRVAMLSYSTGESGKGGAVEKVRQAVSIAKSLRPDLKIEGPMQYDAAIDTSVARTKMPNSEVAGHANIFIFPDLNTGNNTYKAVQRSSGAIAIGPVLQGLNKPVNDLSRGCTVTDIVNTVAITAIQAQKPSAETVNPALTS